VRYFTEYNVDNVKDIPLCSRNVNIKWRIVYTTRNLEPDQWRNREEWRLVSGRRQQLLKKPDR